MKKTFKYFLVSFCLIMFLVFPILVLADSSATTNLKTVGEGTNAPYQTYNPGVNDLASIIGIVIQAFLSILGVLFLIYMIYAGYNWMTAQGDEEKVTKAKETIQRAIIGLIVTIAAYAISYWVFYVLIKDTGIIQ